MLLKNRVVLITAASRGIGAATAKLLGQQGAAVDEIPANGGSQEWVVP